MSAKISIVVPTYREAPNIKSLAARTAEAMADAAFHWEIIIVDDDSRDGIDEICNALQRENFPLRLCVRKNKQKDLSAAVLEGFRLAEGDVLLVMDADLSHPPEKIPELANAVLNESDIAIASRYMHGAKIDPSWQWFRRLTSWIAVLLTRPLVRVSDPMSGFFAVSRECFNSAAALAPVGYKICLELLVKCPARRIAEIPINFENRKIGKSKLNFTQQYRYLAHLRRLYHYRYPTRSEFVHFLAIGFNGLFIDVALFYLLSFIAGLHIYSAKILSFLMTASLNWALNRRFSFVRAECRRPGWQWGRFIAMSVIGVCINFSSFWLLTSSSDRDGGTLIFAAAAAAILTAAWNFFAYKFVVFRT